MPAQKMPKDDDLPTLESTISEIEGLIKEMERGDIPLDESLQCFESGVRLIREAQKSLAEAEQRVSQLIEKDGQFVSEPLDPDENGK